MTTIIKQDDLITSIKDALQFISYYHPQDFIQAMSRAYDREENKAAKDAIAQILINSRMCAEGHRPICQDTGIVNVFLEVGLDVKFDLTMSLDDAVNEGVRQGYLENSTFFVHLYLLTLHLVVKIQKTTPLLLFTTNSYRVTR